LSHVEVTELIAVLLVGDDAKEVTELLLLEVLLGQVLHVALGHWDGRVDDDLGLSLSGNLDGLTEVTCLVVNLDSVTEKLLLRSTIDHNKLLGGHTRPATSRTLSATGAAQSTTK